MKVIDVSSNNHPDHAPIDWVEVAASGVGAAYVKATEGTNYVNPFFYSDVMGALRAGLRVGAYHFARFERNDGHAEAAWFLQHIAGFPLDLPHMLDLETGAEVGWGVLGFRRDQWFETVDATALGAGLYVNLNYYRNLPDHAQDRILWLADPQTAPSIDCWLWQYAVEPVPGCPEPVDVNQLIGTLTTSAHANGGTMLNGRIVGPPIYTESENGYWLIGADGGVFSFGDAWVPDHNPLPGLRLAAPISGGAATRSGRGLLLVGEDGGVFPLGDAVSFGNLIPPASPA